MTTYSYLRVSTIDQNTEKNKLEVLKFVRYEVGEGIQKKEDNFVEEVNKQMRK